MFAPKIAKAQTKAAASSPDKAHPRSALGAQRFGDAAFEQGPMQRGLGKDIDAADEQDASPENAMTAKAPRVWDLDKIALFAPDRANRPQPVSMPLQGALQAKLVVGSVEDPLEREADRAADQVMRMPDPGPSIGASPRQVSRKCASCEEEEEKTKTLKTKRAPGNADIGEVPSVVHEVLRSPGQPLDRFSRAFFEPRFGRDFGAVRIYADAKANASARSIGALAYTVGSNVVFGPGQYSPQTQQGRHLLAHELAHAVQQGRGRGEGAVAQRQTAKLSPTPIAPPVRADETGPGSTDRLGSQTFTCGIYSVFVPAMLASTAGAAGAVAAGVANATAAAAVAAAAGPAAAAAAAAGASVASGTAASLNNVHVFFSPGSVTGPRGGNAVAVHGLRGAADPGKWILIGVPGGIGKAFTISDADIIGCLASVGRPPRIDALQLSAHSRGNAGLAKTLQGRLLTPSLIQYVTILDGTDHAAGLTLGFTSSRVPAGRITADNIVFGSFPDVGHKAVQNIQLPFNCMRSIGYARLISDGVTTGRAPTPLPPDIAAKVSALTLPPRGSFSTQNPPPPGKTSIIAYCADPHNAAALRAMRDGEPSQPTSTLSTSQYAARAATSPYAFIEQNNVPGFNAPGRPAASLVHFNPQIYSHHLFVAEIAHELFT
jgi:hypothetical protein